MNAHRIRDINLILLCLAFVIIFLLIIQIVRPLDQPRMDEDVSSEKITQFPTLESRKVTDWEDLNYNSIAQLNLFSSEREPPSSRATTISREDGEGTVSYEGMELVGTVISDEERSFALIRKGGTRGETKSYRLRDDVEGMELKNIFYDRVILSKNGKEVVLLLEPRETEKKTNIPPKQNTIDRRKTKQGSQQSGQQSWTPKQRKGK